VRLLDLGFFRIGSERYAEDNGTFGLATLRHSHVRIERGVAVFDYSAKGAKRHRQEIADPAIVPTIKALKKHAGAGKELLGYRNGREWVDVRAAHINDYLKEVMGGNYSAKDFRTWNATVLAAVELATNWADAPTKAARNRAAAAACKRVAGYLSNTPAVCRSSYIDPRVFDRYDSGETIQGTLKRIVANSEPGEFPERERIERAVVRLLNA
jgi:DNA topoisomerase IB